MRFFIQVDLNIEKDKFSLKTDYSELTKKETFLFLMIFICFVKQKNLKEVLCENTTISKNKIL